MNDIAQLLPITKIIKIGDEDVTVDRFRFKHFNDINDALKAFGNTLLAQQAKKKKPTQTQPVLIPEAVDALEADAAEDTQEDAAGGMSFVELAMLILDHRNDVAKMIQAATGKSSEWVGERDLDDIAKLAVAVIEVNRNFFVQRLAPAIAELLAEVSGGVR